MKDHIHFRFLVPLLLGAICVGLLLAVPFDFARDVSAVDYYHQEGTPDIQPSALVEGLPNFTGMIKRIKPCVVNVSTTKKVQRPRTPRFQSPFGRDPFFDDFFERFYGGPMGRERKSLGSGFLINDKGHVLTNRHVIAGADVVSVRTSSDKKLEAKVVGEDDKTDIAILKVKAKDLSYCTLGNSDKLQIGEWVIALGNPFGLESTVTAGIVSAKGRVIGAGPYDDFIQTDASINPGNSGGPLFDLNGRVVGINTAIVASGQGIGFAIPVNLAKDLIPQLITKGRVTRGWLGVGIQDMTQELADSFNMKEPQGALVANVFPGSPAEKGGIRSGDVIIEYNGRKIKDSHELPAQVARTPIGQTASVEILRDGKRKSLEVKIVERTEDVQAGAFPTEGREGLGVSVRDISPEEKKELGVSKGQGGVYITRVEPGSAAARSDVRPGDILLSVNGKNVNSAAQFGKLVQKIGKGKIVRFFIRRGDMTIFLAFTR